MKDIAYEEFIERLRVESDIVAIISDYVALKKNGKNYWGCCPFHSEKTASFSVTPDKGFFYCFGCQAGGNVFNFIMKIENIAFFEAVKLLANKINIPLPQKEKTKEELLRDKQISLLYKINITARDFFFSCLTKTNYGNRAKAYLQKRGLNDDVIEDFKIGFAPDSWDKLSKAFAQRGFSDDDLLKAGLVLERKQGGVYDRFRNRVIFPIFDERDRVIGFGGRVMDESLPKYLNSPETIVFNKRQTLFGLNKAYKYIKEANQAIIVEGYMDVIAAHNAGIKNVIASLGTSFTVEQGKKLLRYTENFIFSYDSDNAGQNATLRALNIVKKIGAKVKILVIPDGKDPDEYIKKHGVNDFNELIKTAKPLLDYQIDKTLNEIDFSGLEGKVAVVVKLVPILAETDNAVEVNLHIAAISQKLGIDETSIRSELSKYLSKNNQHTGQNKISLTKTIANVDNANIAAGRNLIQVIWNDNSKIDYVKANLNLEELNNEYHQEIISFILNSFSQGTVINEIVAGKKLSEKANAELSCSLMNEIATEYDMKFIDDCIKTIRLAYLNYRYEQHRLKADELERMGESSFLQELAESQRIKNEINKIHNE